MYTRGLYIASDILRLHSNSNQVLRQCDLVLSKQGAKVVNQQVVSNEILASVWATLQVVLLPGFSGRLIFNGPIHCGV